MEKWVFIAIAIIASSAFYSISIEKKAESDVKIEALKLGFQECSELDSNGYTIILMKKDCK